MHYHYNFYQRGSVRLRKRKRMPDVWEYRYRVTEQGRRKLKSVLVGTIIQFPTKSAVMRKMERHISKLNASRVLLGDPATTFNALIDRFVADTHLKEITAGVWTHPDRLSYSTASGYLATLENRIRPRWGTMRLEEVRPAMVHEWLVNLLIAPKTKANTKALLHRLYEKAILWGLLDLQRNPMELVEVKGASKRLRKPIVLTPEQFAQVLCKLQEPYRTMVLVAQSLGLRASELFALKWIDFDFEHSTVMVSRGIVSGRVGAVKTEYSQSELPLHAELSKSLLKWKAAAPDSPDGWVFPNRKTLRPYHQDIVTKRYLRPIAASLGVPHLGWHTFRHTYRAWLDATGAPVGVQQKLMRHANVATTMNVYGDALMESKKKANEKILAMIYDTLPDAA